MFCDEALDVVEAIAAGEVAPEGRIAAHLETCVDCAGALRAARAVDQMLRTRAVPAPPPNFTTKTMTRVRRARWRSEQYVDLAFNVAIAAVLIAIAAGIWLLLARAGLTGVAGDAAGIVSRVVVDAARRHTPALPVYTGAAALVGTALLIWWWAERDFRHG